MGIPTNDWLLTLRRAFDRSMLPPLKIQDARILADRFRGRAKSIWGFAAHESNTIHIWEGAKWVLFAVRGLWVVSFQFLGTWRD